MIYFQADYNLPDLEGQLFYRLYEHSFVFIPQSVERWKAYAGEEGVTSLLYGTLQLEVAIETHSALFVWGYQPLLKIDYCNLHPPKHKTGGLKINSSPSLLPGVSLSVVKPGEWSIKRDRKTGWICFGEYNILKTSECVEFATNTVAAIKDGSVVALWLRPFIVDSPVPSLEVKV